CSGANNPAQQGRRATATGGRDQPRAPSAPAGAAAGRRRSRRAGRWCPGRSLAEDRHGLIRLLGEGGVATLEQRQGRPGRRLLRKEPLDRRADKLRFGSTMLMRSVGETTLEIIRQVHGGLVHATYGSTYGMSPDFRRLPTCRAPSSSRSARLLPHTTRRRGTPVHPTSRAAASPLLVTPTVHDLGGRPPLLTALAA